MDGMPRYATLSPSGNTTVVIVDCVDAVQELPCRKSGWIC